jgi:hypothetical protein
VNAESLHIYSGILTSLLHTVYKSYVKTKETKQNIHRNIKEDNGGKKINIWKIKDSKSEIYLNNT